MLLALILFIISSLITVFAAIKLAKYGDAIAETTGLGHGLVGLILLSAATSLPELFSSSSASFIGNVDLSFGNVFGSNMTNIFILVILDFFVRKSPILFGASQKNVMTGGIVILITCVALLMMFIGLHPELQGYDYWYFSLILLLFYVGGMIIIYKYEKASQSDGPEDNEKASSSMTKKQAVTGFIISSVFVFGAAILLSYSSDIISRYEIGGKVLGGTFVGTLFMAFTTSLPEIVVSISALRIGSRDMALGNLFGSNLFNIAVLSLSDGFYRLGAYVRDVPTKGNIFSIISPNHFISGLIGIIFVAIVLSSLMLRRKEKRGPLGFDTLTIGILYVTGLYLLYLLR